MFTVSARSGSEPKPMPRPNAIATRAFMGERKVVANDLDCQSAPWPSRPQPGDQLGSGTQCVLERKPVVAGRRGADHVRGDDAHRLVMLAFRRLRRVVLARALH